jgi:Uma2 family endonuclease
MAVQLAEGRTTKAITGDELLALGDIGRCELVEGKIVMLSPTGGPQGGIEVNFAVALATFVRPRNLGLVRSGEVGIYTHRDPDTVRGADVLYISKERAAKLNPAGYMDVAPDLIVEVLSPDDRMSEVLQKLREYFDIGVQLVWIADPATRTVYAYRSLTEVRLFAESEVLPGDQVLPGFSVSVAELFQE